MTFSRWLKPDCDLFWKLLGVAGMVLIVLGLIGLPYRLRLAELHDLYSRCLESAVSEQDVEILALGKKFLEATAGKSSDPRRPQIFQLVEAATLQRIVQLTDEGREDQVEQLLKQHQQLAREI